MIPIIGLMIGLYVITRMVELMVGNSRLLIKVIAAITAVGNAFGMLALFSSGNDVSSVFDRSSPSPSVTSPRTGFDSATSSSATSAAWSVNESTNPIDDSPTVVLSLEASSGRSRMSEAPTLVLRCSRKKTEAYILWNDYLGSDEVSVTTRIGKNEAQTRSWTLSSDNTATFYPGNDVEFIKALLTTDTLVARTTPYNESPVTAVFSVSGLGDKIAPLQAACGWQA